MKHRVLIVAEAANPEWVSVPLEGWSNATSLRLFHDAHIVTQIRNRDAFVRAGLTEGESFTAIDSEALARPMWKLASFLRMGAGKGWTTVAAINALTYPYFEHLIWKQFGARIRDGEFDIVHRVTPLSPTAGSPLASKCRKAGVPFVMGPLNGGVPWPAAFDAERRREREWLSYVRGAYKLLPGHASTLDSASALIAGSRYTAEDLPARHREKTFYIPENAIDPERFNKSAVHQPDGPLRGVFVGRLVPYKGADMLIDAAAPLLRAGRMTLDIVGDGPERGALERRVRDAGCEASVAFRGWLDHHAVQDVLVDCHVMPFPSIREFGGAVALEAMALGVVPLVVNYGGPGELVTDATGYRVPLGNRQQIVAAFSDALGQLAEDRSHLAEMGRLGRERAMTLFTWEAKARQISRVYEWVLDGTRERLVFDQA